MSRRNARAQSARRSHNRPFIEQLEGRRLISGTAQYTEADGDIVTAQVTGNGTVQIFAQTANVWVSGSDVNTTLTITVQKSPTGDGIATMGELRCFGPMSSVNAPNVNFTHEVTTDDNNIPVAPTSKISMNLGQLINLGMWTGGQRIGSLTVADWSNQSTGQQLNAPSIDSFVVTGRPAIGSNPALAGNSDEALFIGDNTTSPSDYSIGYMQVAGRVGDITATGQIGTILAGLLDGQISATTIGRIRATTAGTATADGSLGGSITATGLPGDALAIGIIRGRSTQLLSIAATQGGIGVVRFATDAVGLTVQSAGDLQTVRTGGNLASSRLQAFGSIGNILTAAMSDTDVQVGVANSFTGIATSAGSFVNSAASLGSINVTSIGQPPDQPMITGSNNISAPNIGTLYLVNPDPSALQIYFLGLASPGTVDVTVQSDPAGDIVWHSGQPEPPLLAAMLHYV